MANITDSMRDSFLYDYSGLGAREALDEISSNNKLSLFECIIGVFPEDDIHNFSESYDVMIAAEKKEDVADKAVKLVTHRMCPNEGDSVYALFDAQFIA